ncbi:cytochrome c biogenesis protein CcdA [Clostridium sp. AL.422]|uniref:cytochrome c biogenesis CcdA family protein n=1 Tax=Clostridium TaxID=1485 RepID=UPI00293DFEA3|nr:MULTISPECIES: cytochrome c biogenesis protein CcdA [unclassified Clostridium]MDV4149655.1 cytochrome c biogenesis protein CcdA [Clostridium sp. AL.422]
MDYLILFLEGIITFISPCILPMLPIYISYFMGENDDRKSSKALINSIGFVLGFSIIFTILGAAAGTFGTFIQRYIQAFNIIAGIILIVFGLNYIGIFKISFLERSFKLRNKTNLNKLNLASSVLFGMIFAIGWTPCVGTFLGSALIFAANSQDTLKGVLMLLSYSLGLGLPFIISALLIDSIKATLKFIKKNYKIINTISGILLIIIGLMMMTGYLNLLLSWLTFN